MGGSGAFLPRRAHRKVVGIGTHSLAVRLRRATGGWWSPPPIPPRYRSLTTFYLFTNLPAPEPERGAGNGDLAPADVAEVSEALRS